MRIDCVEKSPPDGIKNSRDEPSRMGERVAAEALWGDERVEERGSLCVGSGGEETYKRVGLLAVRSWEN